MAITKAQQAKQLLQSKAPKGEFLAYINKKEAKMLKDAGGSGVMTNAGIPSFVEYGGRSGFEGAKERNVGGGNDPERDNQKLGLSPFNIMKEFFNTFKWSVNNSMNFVNIIFNMSRKRWSRVIKYISATTGPEGKKQLDNLYSIISKMTSGAENFSKFFESLINFFIENKFIKSALQRGAE